MIMPENNGGGSEAATAEKSLYDRLGGVFAIAAVVEHFSDAVVKNPIGSLASIASRRSLVNVAMPQRRGTHVLRKAMRRCRSRCSTDNTSPGRGHAMTVPSREDGGRVVA
jgi:hypothetical protein